MTTYTLPKEEREYLRKLARRQAEIAALPIMQRRRQMWTDMNDAKPGARPPFAIETWTFDRDFMPESLYQCRSEYGRRLEKTFLRNIRHHELLDDDHVCPDTIDLGWHVRHDEFGIVIRTEHIKDADGIETGYRFDCPIKDLRDGFDMIKPATFSVDRDGTMAEKQFLAETFDGIMPAVIRTGTFGNNMLTQRVMLLMKMETYFMAMYDCPDKLHALMALLRDNSMRISRWAEQEGLLVLNNGNQCTCGTCFNFTTLLPNAGRLPQPQRGTGILPVAGNGRDARATTGTLQTLSSHAPTKPVVPGQVKLCDMWAGMNSQETVGVSPELFHEFCFPYYRDLAAMFGLVYWGCCEPTDPIWETSLSKLPNLKAVSISRWANERYMADVLSGTGIVYSRKPNPNLLGVDVELNEEAWAAEIRGTLEIVAGRNIPLEFIVRDVYTMHRNLGKARRAVEIARREIDRFFPA